MVSATTSWCESRGAIQGPLDPTIVVLRFFHLRFIPSTVAVLSFLVVSLDLLTTMRSTSSGVFVPIVYPLFDNELIKKPKKRRRKKKKRGHLHRRRSRRDERAFCGSSRWRTKPLRWTWKCRRTQERIRTGRRRGSRSRNGTQWPSGRGVRARRRGRKAPGPTTSTRVPRRGKTRTVRVAKRRLEELKISRVERKSPKKTVEENERLT